MKRTILIAVLLLCMNAFCIVSIFHSYHQELHRIIQRDNMRFQILWNDLDSNRPKHAIKMLNEWGYSYCGCVAFEESIIKMVGNKRFMWVNDAWHRIPKVDFLKYLRRNVSYKIEEVR